MRKALWTIGLLLDFGLNWKERLQLLFCNLFCHLVRLILICPSVSAPLIKAILIRIICGLFLDQFHNANWWRRKSRSSGYPLPGHYIDVPRSCKHSTERYLVVVFSACGGICTGRNMPVLTAYFPVLAKGILGKGWIVRGTSTRKFVLLD